MDVTRDNGDISNEEDIGATDGGDERGDAINEVSVLYSFSLYAFV
jgi:hypothetical protein